MGSSGKQRAPLRDWPGAEFSEVAVIVMPANSSGWFWHSLARETGRLGHLFSPGGQRGPWPWFPYALDNGAFSCWTEKGNSFDDAKWSAFEFQWRKLLFWAQAAPLKAKWAIVPDVPGDAARTIERWAQYAPIVQRAGIPLAVAVQNGMTPETVRALSPAPEVIAVGGSTEWKWETVAMWAREFPRVHLLRCNSPTKLYELEAMGVESCDGTGWSRGNRTQTAGLEEWARSRARPVSFPLHPHVCRADRTPWQDSLIA
jgi:hypothetical protein